MTAATLKLVHAAAAAEAANPSEAQAALAKCAAAYQATYRQIRGEGKTNYEAQKDAAVAYRLVMPPMVDFDSIQSYVACVAQGIQFEVFNGRDGAQLLYAAQVALSVLHRKAGASHGDD